MICLTENDRSDAIAYGALAPRISIIPNSIRLPYVPSQEKAGAFKLKHGLKSFLLSVGRLDRVKRGDFLISALALLSEDLQLVFIGPDAGCLSVWRSHAENCGVASRVCFLSEVDDDELLLAYRACTAAVMASAYEGLPTTLLEAMALGAPVVAAASGGIGHVIEDQVNGFLYRYGDIADFCAKVERCLRGVPTALLESAAMRVRERYSWEVNGARVAALYETQRVDEG